MQTCYSTYVVQMVERPVKLRLPAGPAWLQTPGTPLKRHFMADFSDPHQPFGEYQSHTFSLDYPHWKQGNPKAQRSVRLFFSLNFLLAQTWHVCKSHLHGRLKFILERHWGGSHTYTRAAVHSMILVVLTSQKQAVTSTALAASQLTETAWSLSTTRR